MLIYHFGNKERLIEELLDFLASRMAAGLDSAIPAERFASEKDLVKTVIALMRSEPFKPYIRVWLDIISAASQGSDAHRNAGQAIIDVYLDWLATRHPNDTEGAQFALTLIEGTLIMDALGQSATADAACERISS
jgi:AcrR family transcriptional regulator